MQTYFVVSELRTGRSRLFETSSRNEAIRFAEQLCQSQLVTATVAKTDIFPVNGRPADRLVTEFAIENGRVAERRCHGWLSIPL